MHNKKYTLILGSQSPRRKELLQWAFIPYKVLTSDIEEISSKQNVEEFVMDIALQKAQNVFAKTDANNPFVIGADTIVVDGEVIMGKPKTKEEARKMLQTLMGKSHKVYTGVAFKWLDQEYVFYDVTEVHFDLISDELMELYLDTGESMDKAGAYGIQGAALGFIGEIKGSYSNVVGLPIHLVLKKLKDVLKLESKDLRNAFES